MIKKGSLKTLQFAINQALSLDTSIAPKLTALDKKVIKIIIMPLHVTFFMTFESGSLILNDTHTGIIDTTIQSSPIGLIRLSLLPTSKVRSLFNDEISLSGDAELGQQIKQVFDQIDIDWEAHLASFTGDVIAHQVGNMVRGGFAFKQQLKKSMQGNVTEYLQEEARAFPPREEINDFFDDIDRLISDVERIEAHINQLDASHEDS